MRRAAPRPVGLAVEVLNAELEPATALAAIQHAWPKVVGEAIAREAQPVAERAGLLTVACRSAVWAQELDLLSADLLERLNGSLQGTSVRGLRCTAAGWR